ncbi:hypothetical protein K466DRAFT_489540 [Polyporus arcularius HHB13444]|uniref:C2H2-type domain-containing protein n=1 Tax=Polyporus arcularius HHB13444 TaxID=1314778 RepID=A0A5C3PEW3_9APHY|nr:hypothetical protein K466DRAFT_489540 [Polyporus arcularius HHB13444]
MESHRCVACHTSFKTAGQLSRHLGNSRLCEQHYDRLSSARAQRTLGQAKRPRSPSQSPDLAVPPLADDLAPDHAIDTFPDVDAAPFPSEPADVQPAKRPRVTVEEVIDEDTPWSYEGYPGAAASLGTATTFFEEIRAAKKCRGESPHHPFADEEEWGLVQWLMRHTTQTGIDEYGKLPITRNRTKPSFKNKKSFFKKLDQLPTGAGWICDVLTIKGNRKGPNGELLTEELELWRRDPLECVAELMGNPAFKGQTSFAPVMVKKGGVRYWGEMNTADWWWEKQVMLPPGATIAPIILASDKTNLTVLRGDKTAWPVYLTIGNINKSLRRKPSAHAFVLLGYIPVAKFACFTDNERSEALYRFFHGCMAKMLAALKDAGSDGVTMACADGHLRRTFPILAAYIADHPEQCLVACCKENRCPRCTVPRDKRGDYSIHPLRSQRETVEILERVAEGESDDEYEHLGIRPVFKPFWADLPHTDIFTCISPDILHQIHKGVIKDHLLDWIKQIIGKDELDARFATLPPAHGLRHFTRGISMISQWTGGEAKEIEKVLLGLLVGQADAGVLRAARALLDFVYYAQYEVHSETTLARMEQALRDFHLNKHAFVELGIREHFNIPKLHSLLHYIESIRRLGCLDGYNTETSERLHIDLAKKAYRASSKREYYSQMTTWLQRQEAIVLRTAYLSWVLGEEAQAAEPQDDVADEEVEELKALRQLLHSNVARAYQIPLTPSARRVSLDTLITKHGALALLPTLITYLAEHHPDAPRPHAHTPFDIYHSVAVLLPPNIHVANVKRLCSLCARPATPRVLDRQPIPARFDCALFIDDEELYRREGGLQGLRAGEVRAIFRLPARLGFPSDPLMYVRCFRPFRSPDTVTGMPPTSHSTRNNLRNVAIIPMSKLVRPCHLMPRFAQEEIDRNWTSEAILEEPITFSLNRYYDFHLFAALSS